MKLLKGKKILNLWDLHDEIQQEAF